jgi:uncharacterized protein YndB with AHSA1/START domain
MADVTAPAAKRGAPKEAIRTIRMRRRLAASPERVFRAFSDPEELARWFPEGVDGGLAVGSRTTLVWPRRRLWWEVTEATPSRRFVFRWPWDDADRLVTSVTVDVRPSGYGTLLDLEDGPFSIDSAEGLDAWAAGLEGWAEALAMLRAHLDFSVDLRPLV